MVAAIKGALAAAWARATRALLLRRRMMQQQEVANPNAMKAVIHMERELTFQWKVHVAPQAERLCFQSELPELE